MGGRDMTDIHFDRHTHRYTYKGTELASVTTILRGVGIETFWSRDPQYAARGTAVHDAIRLIDGHDQDWDYDPDATLPEYRAYIEQYQRFIQISGFQPLLSEIRVADPSRMECGTFDKYGMLDGEMVLIDIKTGESLPGGVPYQLAGYYRLALAASRHGLWPEDVEFDPECKRKALLLTPDRFKIVSTDRRGRDFSDPAYLADWDAIARTYQILRGLGKLNGDRG